MFPHFENAPTFAFPFNRLNIMKLAGFNTFNDVNIRKQFIIQ